MAERKKKISYGMQRLKYVLADWLSANISFAAFNAFRFYFFHLSSNHDFHSFIFSHKLIAEQIIIPVVLLGIYWLSGYYNHPFKKSRMQEFITTFFSAFCSTLLIYLALLTNDQVTLASTNYLIIGSLFIILFVVTYAFRLLITTRSIQLFRHSEWNYNSIIVGTSDEAAKLARRLSDKRQNLGYNVVGFVEIDGEPRSEKITENIISFDDLEDAVRRLDVEQIFISPYKFDEREVLGILFRLFPLNTTIKISPDTLNYVTSSIHLQDIYAEPFVDLTSPRVSESSKNIKRLLDVAMSSVALALLAVPMAVIAACVKGSSKGPVIYSQERIGYRQRPFRIYKFRSMRTDAEKDGPKLTSENDTRMTPIGKVLRKYRLDELPQFWNVLKGDMSIVGPRPEREYFIRRIVEKAPYYSLVHQVRPGITSWGMVKYGYASTVEEMVERTRYDLIYLSNMSIAVDFKIMIYTIKTVLTGEGK